MTVTARTPFLLAVAALAVTCVGCAGRVTTHGDPVDPIRLAAIVPGTHGKADVEAALGSPSTVAPFVEESWYYISSRSEGFAFMRDEEVERLVVAIRFREDGIVSSVETLELADGHTVDIVSRETPSFSQQTTVLQDMMRNVGRFEKPDTVRR